MCEGRRENSLTTNPGRIGIPKGYVVREFSSLCLSAVGNIPLVFYLGPTFLSDDRREEWDITDSAKTERPWRDQDLQGPMGLNHWHFHLLVEVLAL